MLKSFMLGEKIIPVPVPLTNLSEAMAWIESTFIKKDFVLTLATLDGKDILGVSDTQRKGILLDRASELAVRVDSPRDLSIKTVEAVRDLSVGILSRLQPVAVKCWESDSDVYLSSLREISNDLDLIQDLVGHVSGIMDYTHKEMAPVSALTRLLKYPLADLKASMKTCKWKECSHILLNRIEPLLVELGPESDQLQLRVLSSEDDHQMIPDRRY